jgi:hypothetical protein
MEADHGRFNQGGRRVARDKAPTGKEVRDKANAAKLDSGKAASGRKDGKTSKLTPARLDHVKRIEDLEDGQFIGVVDTEIEGDKSGLPPGKYNMFIAKVGGDWQVYAEADGDIVAQAARVVERPDTDPDMKPEFREGSFCWWMWLIVIGFEWCF